MSNPNQPVPGIGGGNPNNSQRLRRAAQAGSMLEMQVGDGLKLDKHGRLAADFGNIQSGIQGLQGGTGATGARGGQGQPGSPGLPGDTGAQGQPVKTEKMEKMGFKGLRGLLAKEQYRLSHTLFSLRFLTRQAVRTILAL
jgi:hypothetical protein